MMSNYFGEDVLFGVVKIVVDFICIGCFFVWIFIEEWVFNSFVGKMGDFLFICLSDLLVWFFVKVWNCCLW